MTGKLNFAAIRVLVVDGDRYSSGIISQILRGFGVAHPVVVTTAEEAKKQIASGEYHVLITESRLQDTSLDNFIQWVRRHPKLDVRFLPVIVLTGYAYLSRVALARDAGVNSVVCKPVSPIVLYDHIAWAAQTDRPFIEARAYSGPDRRFHGVSVLSQSRRMSDVPADPALYVVPEALP